jgi:hypothetical protein
MLGEEFVTDVTVLERLSPVARSAVQVAEELSCEALKLLPEREREENVLDFVEDSLGVDVSL